MDNGFENSIKRAIALLKTPEEYQKYIVLKFTLVPFSCHHLRHWPEMWENINEYIRPNEPIQDEGNALVERNGNAFVFESHESGPEIVAYVISANAWVKLAKSIVDLAVVIIKCFSRKNRKLSTHIKMSKRMFVNGRPEEISIEIDIPISKEAENKLEQKILDLLATSPKKGKIKVHEVKNQSGDSSRT